MTFLLLLRSGITTGPSWHCRPRAPQRRLGTGFRRCLHISVRYTSALPGYFDCRALRASTYFFISARRYRT